MKKFSFDVHYDMVIQDVEVMAETLEEARQLAYDQAARLPLESMECVGKDACLTDSTELTGNEIIRMEREAVTEFVTKYIGDIIADIAYYSQVKEPRREFKRKLARIAYGERPIHWYCGIGRIPSGHVLTDWLTDFYKRLADGTHERTELYNRYARMAARHEFEARYKNVAKSLYEADVNGCDKMQKKQAVKDAMQVLCDRMEDYVLHQDDEDFKGWEPQMVIRYESETGDEDNYWNLFVYCTGPNDRNDDDYLAVSMAWQHVWTDENGKDATDDYGTQEYQTRTALLQHLFYDEPEQFEETDETPIWERITDVWVD